MAEEPRGPSPSAAAYDALGRVFAASLLMAAPGMLGSWLDDGLGWQWLGFAGFMVGPPLGLGYLLLVYRRPDQGRPRGPRGAGPDE